MNRFILLFSLLAPLASQAQDNARFRVKFDTSDAPEHAAWAEGAEKIGNEWFPRITNIIGSPEHPKETRECIISIKKDYKGVAFASGGRITISNDWVTKNPDDSRGVVVHELTHIVQSYPGSGRNAGWIVEGIADYVRFGVYEAKPIDWFPKPDKPRGYQDSYKVAAGFLLWLEAGPAPGVVRRLNSALRERKYDPAIFNTAGGKPLDELWDAYIAAYKKPAIPLPEVAKVFRYDGGSFGDKGEKKWAEAKKDGEEHAQFEEVERTADHVELLDKSRNIRLRLTSDSVLMEQRGRWGALYRGSWEKAAP